MIKHIFFDLDHTLWDFDRNSALAFKRVFLKHHIELEIEKFLEAYEPINFSYWKEFREERVTKEQLRRGRLTDTFKMFNKEYSLEMIDVLAHSYIEELPFDNHLFSGTVEVLQYLSEKYTLHIITNGFEEVQHLKLKNSKIDHFFETVTTSEEVGVKKPNPKVFQRALEKAAALSHESVMIGDTFEADILGAEAIGMQTIFYNYRKETLPETYCVVNSLLEIKRHL
ncbi:YjjG family noncanonical pyrimidine nucleotidase [Jejudonia soesokkakensis]|uniref:YjjG family noncanonical pyrimidine nucleotidase n=1 Tax=Jejudonia soesokkakensis TaxID=1323432 RepID=A0ABW2MT45_9FLAO